MEWIISAFIVMGAIFIIICFMNSKDNENICFKGLNLFGKIARVVVYTLILGGLGGGALFVLIACVKYLIFG